MKQQYIRYTFLHDRFPLAYSRLGRALPPPSGSLAAHSRLTTGSRSEWRSLPEPARCDEAPSALGSPSCDAAPRCCPAVGPHSIIASPRSGRGLLRGSKGFAGRFRYSIFIHLIYPTIRLLGCPGSPGASVSSSSSGSSGLSRGRRVTSIDRGHLKIPKSESIA